MDIKTLYIGFVREEGVLIYSFTTEHFEVAKSKATRDVDDALPNNVVVVYKILLDTRHTKPIITAIWTPEGEVVEVYNGN